MARDVFLLVGEPPLEQFVVASRRMEAAEAPAAATDLAAKNPGAKIIVARILRVFGSVVTVQEEALP